jgi:hypothetical protein
MKKIKTLKQIQTTMAVPYSVRAKIMAPILNKLIDEDVKSDDLYNKYKEEERDIKITYEEI